MKFENLTQHSTNEELQSCTKLVRMLTEGHPVVFFAKEPMVNRDGVERQSLFLVQARTDLADTKLSKIQAKALGWSPLRLVRTILNFDLKVVSTFNTDEQQLYKPKAIWEGCVIRVQETTNKIGNNTPVLIRGEIKTVNGRAVYRNTVLAERSDKDEKDFIYEEYDLVPSIDEFAHVPEIGNRIDNDDAEIEEDEDELALVL